MDQMDLSQSKQPKAHYDYDGLSGVWLWFPWWFHLSVAVLAWPICWWIFPLLPFKNESISAFLSDYRMQCAIAISIITVMTAFLSYFKAKEIRNRKRTRVKVKKPVVKMDQKTEELPKLKATKKASSASKAEPKVKSASKTSDKSVKNTVKKTAANKTASQTTKAVDKPVKAPAKTKTTKPRARKKDSEKQQQLEF